MYTCGGSSEPHPTFLQVKVQLRGRTSSATKMANFSLLSPPPLPLEAEKVNFDLRDPVQLSLPLPKKAHVIRSNCHVTELNPHSRHVTHLVFKNNYTHSISVKYLPQGKTLSQPESWKYCVKEAILMGHGPHCEAGAQDWFSIKIDLKDAERLRLILRQPSPNWAGFDIDNISLYCEAHSRTTSGTESQTAMTQTHTAGTDIRTGITPRSGTEATDMRPECAEILQKMLDITRRLSQNN